MCSCLQCCDSCGYTRELHLNTHPHLNWKQAKGEKGYMLWGGGGGGIDFHRSYLYFFHDTLAHMNL